MSVLCARARFDRKTLFDTRVNPSDRYPQDVRLAKNPGANQFIYLSESCRLTRLVAATLVAMHECIEPGPLPAREDRSSSHPVSICPPSTGPIGAWLAPLSTLASLADETRICGFKAARVPRVRPAAQTCAD